jgi:SulP family sulfate permease
VLAIVVGIIRLLIGLVGGGPIAYLMSQPVVTAFTAAAATLIVASQVPSLFGVDVNAASPVVGAIEALAQLGAWRPADLLLGAVAVAFMLGGRRLSVMFPRALLAVVTTTLWSALVQCLQNSNILV